jgi:CO/xanthine dehydrogenase Mo-binding subunit
MGEVWLRRMLGVFAASRILNAKTARSQLIGGMIWGVGELGICGAGVAVANAVYNACGARVRDYPITLDKVLPALMRG